MKHFTFLEIAKADSKLRFSAKNMPFSLHFCLVWGAPRQNEKSQPVPKCLHGGCIEKETSPFGNASFVGQRKCVRRLDNGTFLSYTFKKLAQSIRLKEIFRSFAPEGELIRLQQSQKEWKREQIQRGRHPSTSMNWPRERYSYSEATCGECTEAEQLMRLTESSEPSWVKA